MQRRPSSAKPDCEEKRDPDRRYPITQKKEYELDTDTQLEKRTFAADALPEAKTHKQTFVPSWAIVAIAYEIGGFGQARQLIGWVSFVYLSANAFASTSTACASATSLVSLSHCPSGPPVNFSP